MKEEGPLTFTRDQLKSFDSEAYHGKLWTEVPSLMAAMTGACSKQKYKYAQVLLLLLLLLFLLLLLPLLFFLPFMLSFSYSSTRTLLPLALVVRVD